MALGRDFSTMTSSVGQCMNIHQHGSLLFVCPTLKEFDPEMFGQACKYFHAHYALGGKDDIRIAPAPGNFKKPILYHINKWELQGNTLIRHHKRPKKTYSSPTGTSDRPVELSDLADRRETFFENEDGSRERFVDNWRAVGDPCQRTQRYFRGRTVFKPQPEPSERLVGKQPTFPTFETKKMVEQETHRPLPTTGTLP